MKGGQISSKATTFEIDLRENERGYHSRLERRRRGEVRWTERERAESEGAERRVLINSTSGLQHQTVTIPLVLVLVLVAAMMSHLLRQRQRFVAAVDRVIALSVCLR